MKKNKHQPKIPEEYRDLNPREKMFCLEYLKDKNETRAYIRAGYSSKGARANASRLIAKDSIRDEIRAQIEAQFERIKIDADSVLKLICQISFVDPTEAYNPDGSLKPISEMPKPLRMAIQSVEVDELWGPREDGPGREQIGFVKKVKFISRLDAARDLGRHLKLFTDVVEHRGIQGLAQQLAESRKRRKTCRVKSQSPTKAQTK